MADKKPRWEQDAERVRQRGPHWLDADRLPWWAWVIVGIAWSAWGAYVLLTGDRWWDWVSGLVLLVLPPLGAFRGARRPRRGESFFPHPG